MAVPNENPPDALVLQEELNQERDWVVQLTKKFNHLLNEKQNSDTASQCAQLEQKKSEEKCATQEKLYKETIDQWEMRNRILESIVTDYKEEMTIARRGEAAQKEANDLLEAEKLVLQANNQELEAKNKKLAEEMAALLAAKEAQPQISPDQMAEEKPAEKQEMDAYEAEIINLNEHITAQQKKITELSAEVAEKNDYMLAVEYLENALNNLEKERDLLKMNYHVDRDGWKNREAKYQKDLEKVKTENEKIANELQNWKDATENAIAKLETINQERELLRKENIEWRKKDQVYQQMNDILHTTKRDFKKAIEESKNEAKESREKLREISAVKEQLEFTVYEKEDLIKTLHEFAANKENKIEAETKRNRHLIAQLSSANELKTFFQRENDQLKQKVAQLESKDMAVICKICFEAPVQNLFQCGHSACDGCYPFLNGCHICRRAITQVHKLYFT